MKRIVLFLITVFCGYIYAESKIQPNIKTNIIYNELLPPSFNTQKGEYYYESEQKNISIYDIKYYIDKLTTVEKTLKDKLNKIKEYKDLNYVINLQNEKLEKENKKHKLELSKNLSTISNLNAEIQNLTSKVIDLNNKNKKIKTSFLNEKKQLLENIKHIKDELNSKISLLDSYKKKYLDLKKNNNKELVKIIETFKQKLSEISEKNKKITDKLKYFEQVNNDLKQNIKKKDRIVADLQNKNFEIITQLNKKDKTINKIKRIKRNKTLLSDLETKYNKAINLIENKNLIITNLIKTNSINKTKISNLISSYNELKKELQEEEINNICLSTNLAIQKEEYNSLLKSHTLLSNKLRDVQKKLSEKIIENKNLKIKIEKIENELKKQQKKAKAIIREAKQQSKDLPSEIMFSMKKEDKNFIVILNYHRFGNDRGPFSKTAEQFENEIKYLIKKHYSFLDMKDLRDIQKGKQPPKRGVIITIDDGYRDIYDIAYPILKKYGIHKTVLYIYTGLKYINHAPSALKWAMLKEMSNYGFTIGSHTHTHDNIAKRKNSESYKEWEKRIRTQLSKSKAIIEKKLNIKVYDLSTPYGIYSERVEKIARSIGYSSNVLLYDSNNYYYTSMMHLRRILLKRGDKLSSFAYYLRMKPKYDKKNYQKDIIGPNTIVKIDCKAFSNGKVKLNLNGKQISSINKNGILIANVNGKLDKGRNFLNISIIDKQGKKIEEGKWVLQLSE